MIKITVVTVCYQAEKTIEKTIQSVVNQDYSELEYWIVDGKSTDKTVDIILKYAKEYPFIKWLSEPDEGIYNAMNKAAKLATGEYIYFLNCGDLFVDSQVIHDVLEFAEEGRPDLLYGNIYIDYGTERKKIEYVKWKRLHSVWIALGITICHQAIFAKRKLLVERGFDEKFRFWADQEWLMYCMAQKQTVQSFERQICVYDAYGVSSSGENLEIIFRESDDITRKYTPVIYYATVIPKYFLRIYRRIQKKCLKREH